MFDPVMTYICRRCGRSNTITAPEFARLPDMTKEEIAASDLKQAAAEKLPSA